MSNEEIAIELTKIVAPLIIEKRESIDPPKDIACHVLQYYDSFLDMLNKRDN